MADFNNPLSDQPYLALLESIVENNQANLKMLEGVAPLTNLPTNAKRWNPANARWENWNSTAWEELAALFEMKVRNSDQLNGQTEDFYRNAGNMNAGALPSGRFNDTSHGIRGNGSLHAVCSTVANGFMSALQFDKLRDIEDNATADQSGAEILAALLPIDGPGTGLNSDYVDNYHAADLLARNNHTGTQSYSTISGLKSLALLDQVPASSIGQVELGENSVGQSEVKTTYQQISGTVPSDGSYSLSFTPSGGIYILGATFYGSVTPSGGIASFNHSEQALSTSILAAATFSASQNGGLSFTAYGRLYYINSSPPYDLGFGNIPLFIFLIMDTATKEIEGMSVSTEAPWHYNGPTNITPDSYAKDGTPFKRMREIELELMGEGKTLRQELLGVGRAAIQARFETDPIIEVEIDQVMKNADMALIPHPFSSNDLAGKTIAVINPQSDICETLLILHNQGGNVAELFHNGDIVVETTPMVRGFDPSVKCFDINYK